MTESEQALWGISSESLGFHDLVPWHVRAEPWNPIEMIEKRLTLVGLPGSKLAAILMTSVRALVEP